MNASPKGWTKSGSPALRTRTSSKGLLGGGRGLASAPAPKSIFSLDYWRGSPGFHFLGASDGLPTSGFLPATSVKPGGRTSITLPGGAIGGGGSKTNVKNQIASHAGQLSDALLTERALSWIRYGLLVLLIVLGGMMLLGMLFMPFFTILFLMVTLLALFSIFAEDSTLMVLSRQMESMKDAVDVETTAEPTRSASNTRSGFVSTSASSSSGKQGTGASSSSKSTAGGKTHHLLKGATIATAGRPVGSKRCSACHWTLWQVRRGLLWSKRMRLQLGDEMVMAIVMMAMVITFFVPSDSPTYSHDSPIHHSGVVFAMLCLCPVIVFSYTSIMRESSLLKHAQSIRSTSLATTSPEVQEMNAEIQRLLQERDYFKSSKVSYLASWFLALFRKTGQREQESKIHQIFVDAHDKLLLQTGGIDIFNALVQTCDLEILLDRLQDRGAGDSRGGSRTQLISFLTEDAVEELTVRSRVLIINALQVLKFTCSPEAEIGVQRIIMNTLGDDLTNLKSMTDSKGSIHGFWKLVFSDLGYESRCHVLRHIWEQSTMQVYTRLVHRDQHLQYLVKRKELMNEPEEAWEHIIGMGGPSTPPSAGTVGESGAGSIRATTTATPDRFMMREPGSGRKRTPSEESQLSVDTADRGGPIGIDSRQRSGAMTPTTLRNSAGGRLAAQKLSSASKLGAVTANKGEKDNDAADSDASTTSTVHNRDGSVTPVQSGARTPLRSVDLGGSLGGGGASATSGSGGSGTLSGLSGSGTLGVGGGSTSSLAQQSSGLGGLKSIGEDAQYYLSNSGDYLSFLDMGAAQQVFQGLQARHQWMKILTDMDDTLLCSGGNHIAGLDMRYPRKCIYPGVTTFYKVLEYGDVSLDAYSLDKWYLSPSSLANRVTPACGSRWQTDFPQTADAHFRRGPLFGVIEAPNTVKGGSSTGATGTTSTSASSSATSSSTPAATSSSATMLSRFGSVRPVTTSIGVGPATTSGTPLPGSPPATPDPRGPGGLTSGTGTVVTSTALGSSTTISGDLHAGNKIGGGGSSSSASAGEGGASSQVGSGKMEGRDSSPKRTESQTDPIVLHQPATIAGGDTVIQAKIASITAAFAAAELEACEGGAAKKLPSGAGEQEGAVTMYPDDPLAQDVNNDDSGYGSYDEDSASVTPNDGGVPRPDNGPRDGSEGTGSPDVLASTNQSGSSFASSPDTPPLQSPQSDVADGEALGSTQVAGLSPGSDLGELSEEHQHSSAAANKMLSPLPVQSTLTIAGRRTSLDSASSPPMSPAPTMGKAEALEKTSSSTTSTTGEPIPTQTRGLVIGLASDSMTGDEVDDDDALSPPITPKGNVEDDSPGSEESSTRQLEERLDCNFGHLVGFSSRPHIVGDLMESHLFEYFAKMQRENGLHCMPALLPGGIGTAAQFVWHGDFGPLGDKKYENFTQYQSLYPEFKWIFLGDNGQADYYTATKMLDWFPHVVETVYIHVVQPLVRTYGYSKGVHNRRYLDQICFYEDYIEAALHACCRQRSISCEALWHVTWNVVNEFEAIRKWDAVPLTTRQKEVARLTKNVQRVNAFLEDLYPRYKHLPKIRPVHLLGSTKPAGAEGVKFCDAAVQTDGQEVVETAKSNILSAVDELETLKKQMGDIVGKMERKVVGLQESVRSTVMENEFLRADSLHIRQTSDDLLEDSQDPSSSNLKGTESQANGAANTGLSGRPGHQVDTSKLDVLKPGSPSAVAAVAARAEGERVAFAADRYHSVQDLEALQSNPGSFTSSNPSAS
ncbi:unnamed protein product [Amoebophrya sp. A25]|nr:unnamed protein product [Amoebophrya sp. A25]|eukprot:GSA25T00010492001.1